MSADRRVQVDNHAQRAPSPGECEAPDADHLAFAYRRHFARCLPDALRTLALELVRATYAAFGPTSAHAKLVENHGLVISVETLRKCDLLWKFRTTENVGPLADLGRQESR